MRRATLAVVLLGLLACVSAGDVSRPKGITGRLSCVLPVSKLQCIRDWRSGFVASVRMGYQGFEAADDWVSICGSSPIGNQTRFDMSVPDAIDAAQRAAPEWYRNIDNSFYLYPQSSPITQVIVLRAPNPWGDKFGTIAAIMFGYQTDDGLDFAVCGNALYAQFYLNPARAPAPPTPVTLKATFTSSLSEDGKLTALGSLDGLCSTRGGGYLGGDPWRSSKYFIKAVTKPCFVAWDAEIQSWDSPPSDPPKRVIGHYECDDDDEECNQTCHWDKKNSKKSASYSCAMAGTAIATGKYGAIMFDKHGHKFDWDRDEKGHLQQVKASDSVYEGEPEQEEN